MADNVLLTQENLLRIIEDNEEENRIREFLKKLDGKYYHRKIEIRLDEMKKFPLLGEDGYSFINTYHYVKLKPKGSK
ncbi:MAG: hypothetical protein MJ055_01630 [Phascolarctobacterium sp.]|nr:hypothetical protein [Phascolarctobacterium sp.]